MGRHFTLMAKAKNGQSLTTEDILWAIVIVLLLVQRRPISWAMLLTVLQYIVELALIVSHRKRRINQSSQWRKGGDEGGFMQIALLACLFHSSRMFDHEGNLAKLLTIVSATNLMLSIASFVVAICLGPSLRTTHSAIFMCSWLWLTALAKGRQGSLTKGESSILVSLSTVLISETAMTISCYFSCSDISHSLVALWGGAGCVATCIALIFWRLPWWLRIQFHLLGPLAMVETGLSWYGYSQRFNDYVPRCLDWLFEFLLEREGGYPRYEYDFFHKEEWMISNALASFV